MHLIGSTLLFGLEMVDNILPAVLDLVPDVDVGLKVGLGDTELRANILVLPNKIIAKKVLT